MSNKTRALGGLLAATAVLLLGSLTIAAPASAASLTEVTNFGPNPTNLRMHLYVPDSVGAAFAGVPFACFATTDGSMWNHTCAEGQLIRSAQQWGDLVRGAFPGYSGPRPRMQLWHGTADDTLRYPNLGEQIKQWTDVTHQPY